MPDDSTSSPAGDNLHADPKQTHVAVQWKHDHPLMNCRFDPQGRFVVASSEDMTIQRWDLKSEAKVALAAHESWIPALEFLPDGQILISGGCDGQLIWWPVADDKPAPIRKVAAHDGWIRYVSSSADGTLLATCGNDKLVKIWNAADGKLVRQMGAHDKDIYSTLFHPDGTMLLSGDLAGQVEQWEVATGKRVRSFDAKALHTYHGGQRVDYGGVRSMCLSPDGKHLACSGLHKATNPLGAVNEPLVLRFDWQSQKLLESHIGSGVRGITWRALFHPQGFLIGASGGSGGGFLLFWEAGGDKEFHKLKLPDTARGMDLHPDGIQVATAHYDRHLRISRMQKKSG